MAFFGVGDSEFGSRESFLLLMAVVLIVSGLFDPCNAEQLLFFLLILACCI